MNENERAEPAPERAARETQSSLFERLRGLLGLGAGSVRDDIEDALEGADSNADFTPQERAILKNVLALHEVRVADVMVPRADILAVASDTPLSEVLALFRTAGHSRFPVFGETLDDPQGMIHIRDFVDFLASEPKFGLALPNSPSPVRERMAGVEIGMNMPLSAAEILRPVLFAPPSMPALDLLVKMQASRTHMALVIDEYGGTDGLVSIEDVVEAIVGDIEDEHDEAERPQIVPGGDGSFLVEARAPLDEVSEAVGFDFGALADAEDVDRGPSARARRNRRGSRRVRIRGARRGSPARQAAEDSSARRPRSPTFKTAGPHGRAAGVGGLRSGRGLRQRFETAAHPGYVADP
jgi:CBS domain containing-hemolysin-like protein